MHYYTIVLEAVLVIPSSIIYSLSVVVKVFSYSSTTSTVVVPNIV